jgi:transposase-like protein
MALSDVPKEKDLKRSKDRRLSAAHSRWSDKQKLEAVQSYLALGNLSMVARLHNIPRITLQVWKASNWWKELVDEIKVQDKIEMSNKLKAIVKAAHTVVANRLETGDAVMNQKTGEIVYKPVSMKDAHRVAVDLLNQQQVLDKALNNEAPQEQNTDRLEQLAEKFAEFATKKIEQKLDNKRTIEMADVVEVEIKEPEDAVHDEWEEGLQEGESPLRLEARSGEEAGGEECSPSEDDCSGQGS